MPNSYYNQSNTFTNFALARGDHVNTEIDAIEAGFDAVEAAIIAVGGTAVAAAWGNSFDTRWFAGTTTGSSNAYSITPAGPPDAADTIGTGYRMQLKFNATNTGSITLNIGTSEGAVTVQKYTDAGAKSNLASGDIDTSRIYELVYDGSNWILDWSGDTRDPYSTVSQVEAEAGTATTVRNWTAQRVGQAVAALETAHPTTVSQAEAEAGTATTDRYWTAQRVGQAIAAQEMQATNILDKATNYPIVTGDTSGYAHCIVKVDASGASRTITLPTAANFNGALITVMADADPGTNSVIINDSGASEYWTCYEKGDFVTVASDGTNLTFVDGWVTVVGRGRLTGGDDTFTAGQEAQVNGAAWTADVDVGGWWDGTNYEVDVGFDCLIHCTLLIAQSTVSNDCIDAGFKQNTTYVPYDLTERAENVTQGRGSPGFCAVTLQASSGDTIEPWGKNADSDDSVTADAGATVMTWSVIRRLKT